MVTSSLSPTVSDGALRWHWLLLATLPPVAAASVAAARTAQDWRWWTMPEYWPEGLAAMATYLACLLLYRSLLRQAFPRLRSPFLTPIALRACCVLLGFGLLALTVDGLSIEMAPGFFGTAVPILVVASALLGPRSAPRELRIGLVPAGRINELMQLRAPGIQRLLLREPSAPSVDVVVADLHHNLSAPWATFLADCQLKGTPVIHAGAFYEHVTGRTSLRYLREYALRGVEPARTRMLAKRAGELVLITVTAPLWLLLAAATALAIRLESRGPVLFVQERVGFRDQPFNMYKFRSMRVGSDDGGPLFAQRGDSRITKVGGFIRRVRIDEIPQLFNVLRGDMSLIGPRPEQTLFAAEFSRDIPFYASRHNVRPGITGWAQINSGYAAGKEETVEKLEFDLYYVRHLSLWLDAQIAWRSVRTVISGSGAR